MPDVVINSAFVMLEIVVISAAVVDEGNEVDLSVGNNDETVVADVVFTAVSNPSVGVGVSFNLFVVD